MIDLTYAGGVECYFSPRMDIRAAKIRPAFLDGMAYIALFLPNLSITPIAITIAVALAVLAVGALSMAILRRQPDWSVWTVPVLGVPAALLGLSTLSLDASTEPEVYGLAVGAPAAVAAFAWWWLRRPRQTPTWQTIAPPFVLALTPSVLALSRSAADRL